MGSGLLVYGEQRSVSAADFDHDGRLDLVITQNGGQTRLYRNQSQASGLRVIVVGPPENPDSVGAKIRLLNAAGEVGPCRLISSIGGYSSQHALARVYAKPAPGLSLQVLWPDSKKVTVSIDPGNEIRVRHPGAK